MEDNPAMDEIQTGEGEERILNQFDGVKAVKAGRDLGAGKLIISSQQVTWKSSTTTNPTELSLSYQSIGVHGIVRDASEPYMLLVIAAAPDSPLPAGGGGDQEEDEDIDEDLEPTYEIRFIPLSDVQTILGDMNTALKEGQQLNPDPDQEEDSDLGDELDFELDEGEFAQRENEAMDEDPEIRHHRNGLPPPEPGQFDDA